MANKFSAYGVVSAKREKVKGALGAHTGDCRALHSLCEGLEGRL